MLVTDFKKETGAVFIFERGKVSLTDITAKPLASAEPSKWAVVLIVFSWGKEGLRPPPIYREMQQAEEKLLASTARAIARVEQIASQSLEQLSRHSNNFTGSRNSACLMPAYSSGRELNLPYATVLGLTEPMIDRIYARSETSGKTPNKPPRKRNNKVRYDKRQEYTLNRENFLRL
jgi:hypothetical protein